MTDRERSMLKDAVRLLRVQHGCLWDEPAYVRFDHFNRRGDEANRRMERCEVCQFLKAVDTGKGDERMSLVLSSGDSIDVRDADGRIVLGVRVSDDNGAAYAAADLSPREALEVASAMLQQARDLLQRELSEIT